MHFKYFFIILIFLSINSFSQQNNIFICGTQINSENLKILKKTLLLNKSIDTNTYYLPVKIHIIRKDDGSGGIDTNLIFNEINITNNYFKNAGIKFFICSSIDYINNSNYYNFNSSLDEELTNLYDIPRVINIYYFNDIINSDKHICGYAYLPPASPDIFINNKCSSNSTTLAHEFGHIFSLLHTHGPTDLGKSNELVNGSNCNIAGDLICDTPADPNLLNKINNNCEYIGNDTDINGDKYHPDTSNIMSYSLDKCKNSFTSGQYKRIRKALFYFNLRDLICNENYSNQGFVSVSPLPPSNKIEVKFFIDKDSFVSLSLYDIMGKEISLIKKEKQKAGLIRYYISYNKLLLAQGIYILRLYVNGKIYSNKIFVF